MIGDLFDRLKQKEFFMATATTPQQHTEQASHSPATSPDMSAAYHNLRQALLGLIRKQVSDNMVAEDILHEVFLKALAAIEHGDTPNNLTGWLYSIARNAVIDHYRAKRPVEELSEDLAIPVSEDNLAEQDLALCIKPLTMALPALYRDTLLATDFAGQTLKMLADKENVSISAMKSRASRGRQMLRQNLLACCQVELSIAGHVLDFDQNAASSPCAGHASCRG